MGFEFKCIVSVVLSCEVHLESRNCLKSIDFKDIGGGLQVRSGVNTINNNNTLALMINHQRQIICVEDGCEVSKHFSGNNNS